MGVQAEWDNEERTILHYRFDQTWTWEDFYRVLEWAHTQIEEVKHPVGVIMSGPANMKLPPYMLTHARKLLERKKSSYTKIIVFTTESRFAHVMVGTLAAITRKRLPIVTSLDVARSLIAEALNQPETTVRG